MKQNNKIHIGTSGWNYKHWKGIFHPEDLPERKWLEYYSVKFKTVELKGSYSRTVFKEWTAKFQTWASEGREVFWYFDNDEKGYAAENAAELQNML